MMKLKILGTALILVVLQTRHCQASINFPEESFASKKGITYVIAPVQGDAHRTLVTSFLKGYINSIMPDLKNGEADIGVYIVEDATSERKLVGTARFSLSTEHAPYLLLCYLAVSTECQGEGIGTAILNYLMTHCQTTIKLFPLQKSIQFYLKAGFAYKKEDKRVMYKEYVPVPTVATKSIVKTGSTMPLLHPKLSNELAAQIAALLVQSMFG